MTKARCDTSSVLDTAMQIVEGEHDDYVDNHIDDREHVARIVRIAESAGRLLKACGHPKRTVETHIQRIIRYGRQLFIHEWSVPVDGEDEQTIELQAIAEFERYLPDNRKEKRKSSNQAL